MTEKRGRGDPSRGREPRRYGPEGTAHHPPSPSSHRQPYVAGLKSRSDLRPTWLANAHAALDGAVFAAYGWSEGPNDLDDEEILKRLLVLNLERASTSEEGR